MDDNIILQMMDTLRGVLEKVGAMQSEMKSLKTEIELKIDHLIERMDDQLKGYDKRSETCNETLARHTGDIKDLYELDRKRIKEFEEMEAGLMAEIKSIREDVANIKSQAGNIALKILMAVFGIVGTAFIGWLIFLVAEKTLKG